MPRPESKQEILESINIERRKLNEALAELTEVQLEIPGACEDWSVKDIISHLMDWQERCMGWYRAGLRGDTSKIPDDKFNWQQLSTLNHQIYLKYKDLRLAEAQDKFDTSFKKMIQMIEGMSEKELFTVNYYEWTGKDTLSDFIDANTASHYCWASKLVNKFRRNVSKFKIEQN